MYKLKETRVIKNKWGILNWILDNKETRGKNLSMYYILDNHLALRQEGGRAQPLKE